MPVTDLTGTTWVFNDSIIYGPGGWRFDEFNGNNFNFSIDFISNSENFTSIRGEDKEDQGESYIRFYPGPYSYVWTGSNGWIGDAIKTITITGGTDATNSTLISWLEANATKQESTPKVSVDLTTLTGWSSLSDGSHSITIVAKADGYRDSEPSAAVSVEKAPQEYTDCITFTGESSDFTLAVGSGGAKEWDGTVEYSTDHNTWTTWNGTAISSVDKKLYLRGSGNTKFHTSKGAKFVLSARAACSGNIQTLLEYSNPPTSIPATNCYRYMFQSCTNLTTAPALPATTLTDGCYRYMFRDCTNLTQAPELPATTLTDGCYNTMFRGCTSLTQAPALPATTLAPTCYFQMFYGCTSLTQAPALPATTLAATCYAGMFQNCTSLKISATQSSEYPTAWRIPSSGTISSEAIDWNLNMLNGTGGTFTSNPSINTTYYGAWTSATPTLISFTIEGTSYQAEEGMTWKEWVNSSYNTDGYYVKEDGTITNNVYFVSTPAGHVSSMDTIISDYLYAGSGGGVGN